MRFPDYRNIELQTSRSFVHEYRFYESVETSHFCTDLCSVSSNCFVPCLQRFRLGCVAPGQPLAASCTLTTNGALLLKSPAKA